MRLRRLLVLAVALAAVGCAGNCATCRGQTPSPQVPGFFPAPPPTVARAPEPNPPPVPVVNPPTPAAATPPASGQGAIASATPGGIYVLQQSPGTVLIGSVPMAPASAPGGMPAHYPGAAAAYPGGSQAALGLPVAVSVLTNPTVMSRLFGSAYYLVTGKCPPAPAPKVAALHYAQPVATASYPAFASPAVAQAPAMMMMSPAPAAAMAPAPAAGFSPALAVPAGYMLAPASAMQPMASPQTTSPGHRWRLFGRG